jgi:hypothetical protein
MGVAFGRIQLTGITSGYDFFQSYCRNNKIEIVADYPDDRLITTSNIPNLTVIAPDGREIKGQGTNIEGMDREGFEVAIAGIPYPFFEEEFPHHVRTYNGQFKDSK